MMRTALTVRMTLSAAIAFATIGGLGCEGGDAADGTESTPVAVESKVVAIDSNSSAEASRFSDGRVRVEVRGSDARLRFATEFQKKEATVNNSKVVVKYELHLDDADDNMSPQRIETSALELEMAEPPTLEDAVNGTVFLQTQFTSAILGNYDNWGCDLLPGKYNWVASCGPKGACCDIHDACYKRHNCTASSWKHPFSTCFLLCNAPAVACFASPIPLGPSECCFRGNCGKPR
jgi:hypothetical protein